MVLVFATDQTATNLAGSREPGAGGEAAAAIAGWSSKSLSPTAQAFVRGVVASAAPGTRARAKALLFAAGKLTGFGESVGSSCRPGCCCVAPPHPARDQPADRILANAGLPSAAQIPALTQRRLRDQRHTPETSLVADRRTGSHHELPQLAQDRDATRRHRDANCRAAEGHGADQLQAWRTPPAPSWHPHRARHRATRRRANRPHLSAISDEYVRLLLIDPDRFPPQRLLQHARWWLARTPTTHQSDAQQPGRPAKPGPGA